MTNINYTYKGSIMNYRIFFAAVGLISLLTSSVALAQFQRNVVIEEFTSVTCAPCVTATKVLNEVIEEKGERVISVRYHMNIPSQGDPWYKASKGDVDVRSGAQVYNIFGIPAARVNGLSAKPTDKPDLLTAVNETLAMDAPVGIEVTQTRAEGNSINVSVDVTAGDDGLGAGYKLYVAVVECLIHEEEKVKNLPQYNGETEFFDVFRAFVNSANGEEIALNRGQKKTVQHSYTIDEDWQDEELFVVAFVQDEFTFEVVQAGYSSKLVASVTEVNPMPGYEFGQIIPNPATSNARVSFDLGNPESGVITLHSANGQLVRETDLGRLEAGNHLMNVETGELPAGVYTVTLRAGQYRASRKLLVVQ